MALETIDDVVTVKLPDLDGVEQKFTGPVKYVQFGTWDDVFKYFSLVPAEAESRKKESLARLNQGIAQNERSLVRQKIVADNAGPERTVTKMADQMFREREKAGKPISKELARKIATTAYKNAVKAALAAEEEASKEVAA